MDGLRLAVVNLTEAGAPKIWVDGSFVTDKPHPNDIDGVWDYDDATDVDRLDPAFLLGQRAALKARYGLDFFPNVIEAGSGKPFPEFFMTNRDGDPKGIVVIHLKA